MAPPPRYRNPSREQLFLFCHRHARLPQIMPQGLPRHLPRSGNQHHYILFRRCAEYDTANDLIGRLSAFERRLFKRIHRRGVTKNSILDAQRIEGDGNWGRILQVGGEGRIGDFGVTILLKRARDV